MTAAQVIYYVTEALIWIVIIDVILTWIPSVDRRNPFVMLLRSITEPMYRPIRRVIPPNKTGFIDLSPIVIIFGLQIIRRVLISLLLR